MFIILLSNGEGMHHHPIRVITKHRKLYVVYIYMDEGLDKIVKKTAQGFRTE